MTGFVESNVAIQQGLYNNWSITSPAKDSSVDSNGNPVMQTQDPSKIHFTTRYYAYTPMRIHPFQISVRRQPDNFIPVQFGQVTKYLAEKGILIDTWVLTGPNQSLEQAETSWYAMIQEVKRIVRVYSTQFGSGIQSVLLGRTVPDEAALNEASPKLHGVTSCKARLYETVTS
jgi:hypothetical protein